MTYRSLSGDPVRPFDGPRVVLEPCIDNPVLCIIEPAVSILIKSVKSSSSVWSTLKTSVTDVLLLVGNGIHSSFGILSASCNLSVYKVTSLLKQMIKLHQSVCGIKGITADKKSHLSPNSVTLLSFLTSGLQVFICYWFYGTLTIHFSFTTHQSVSCTFFLWSCIAWTHIFF